MGCASACCTGQVAPELRELCLKPSRCYSIQSIAISMLPNSQLTGSSPQMKMGPSLIRCRIRPPRRRHGASQLPCVQLTHIQLQLELHSILNASNRQNSDSIALSCTVEHYLIAGGKEPFNVDVCLQNSRVGGSAFPSSGRCIPTNPTPNVMDAFPASTGSACHPSLTSQSHKPVQGYTPVLGAH